MLEKLAKRADRERQARLSAEAIAERSLRELYDKKEQLQLIGSVATAANQSRCVEEVLQFALTKVCETIKWPIGHAYLCRSETEHQCVKATDIWHGIDHEAFRQFRAVSEETTFETGIGLPGRVLASGKPTWIEDLSTDRNFQRAPIALRAGLKTGCAFPVLVGDQVVAILEFFNSAATPPDLFILHLMSQIGAQLGRVVERRQTEEQLIHDASHDSLTKLPNRTLFLDRLNRVIALRKRHPCAKYAVLFIDLDRFKIVNDSLGHQVGDILLVHVAERLRECLRRSDLLATTDCIYTGPVDLLARMGGDEFTILLENLHRLGDALGVADRLQASLVLPFQIQDRVVYVSASIGIAWGESDYTCADDVLRDADLAMYQAKSRGKARYEVFDTALFKAAQERLELESDLQSALYKQEFLLHYQPIVSLKTGQITGFEALIRWQRPGGVLLYPDSFISVAEDTGLIVPIGEWVLTEACKTMNRWHKEYPRTTPLTISVNLSARQLAQSDLLETLTASIQKSGIDPSTIHLEVTESMTMADPGRATALLMKMRTVGVSFSLDDFGTGYSSLSYLHRLPLQILKIDKAFVRRMGQDQDSYAIVNTILHLARSLGMKVVAEGVETAEHVAALTKLGCDYAQGYFYSRPTNEPSVAGLLLNEGCIQ